MVTPVVFQPNPPQAVLRVSGDAAAIYRRYVAQLRATAETGATVRARRTAAGGWTIVTTVASNEFGSFTADLLTRHGVSYVRLTAVHE
ncbi:MAG: hypothetical protein ABJC79_15185 [Acidimicrobiia bacterium]